MDNQRKRKHEMDHKKSHFYKKPNRNYLVAGQRGGFLATCSNNYREKCARECMKILGQYADQLYGKEDFKKSCQPTDNNATNDETDEIEDISTTLEKEINATVTAHKQKLVRFQQLDTGASNLVFIRTTLPNPIELGTKIVRDIAETKQHQSRFVLRLIPIEIVCKANLKDILNEAGKLFDKHFLNCPATTFSILFNRRYNNSLGRDEVIAELAELVKFKNMHHKVNLSTPDFTVVCEIIKGLCCLSVVPQYIQLKKYNLFELGVNKDDGSTVKKSDNDKKQNENVDDSKKDDENDDTKEEDKTNDAKDDKEIEGEVEETSQPSNTEQNEAKSSND